MVSNVSATILFCGKNVECEVLLIAWHQLLNTRKESLGGETVLLYLRTVFSCDKEGGFDLFYFKSVLLLLQVKETLIKN